MLCINYIYPMLYLYSHASEHSEGIYKISYFGFKYVVVRPCKHNSSSFSTVYSLIAHTHSCPVRRLSVILRIVFSQVLFNVILCDCVHLTWLALFKTILIYGLFMHNGCNEWSIWVSIYVMTFFDCHPNQCPCGATCTPYGILRVACNESVYELSHVWLQTKGPQWKQRQRQGCLECALIYQVSPEVVKCSACTYFVFFIFHVCNFEKGIVCKFTRIIIYKTCLLSIVISRLLSIVISHQLSILISHQLSIVISRHQAGLYTNNR